MSAPFSSRAMDAPAQAIVPVSSMENTVSGAPNSASTRASISLRNALFAAVSKACRPSAAELSSGANRKPSRCPTNSPSTTTSPSTPTTAIRSSRSFIRENAAARRSTKRWVRLVCRASEILSSSSRVRVCQVSGSLSQSARWEIYVHVRTWAIRAIRVSISPSTRSSCAICAATQSTGRQSPSVSSWNIRDRRPAWTSAMVFLKSGIWQISQSRRTTSGVEARSAIFGSRSRWERATLSSASRARISSARGGGSSSDFCRPWPDL